MKEFSHIGLVTEEKKGEENLIEQTRVLVTNFNNHPFKVEWLRFCSDSPIRGAVREKPHIAFYVDDINKESKGLKVLIEPFTKSNGVVVGFYEYVDGTVVEFMQQPK